MSFRTKLVQKLIAVNENIFFYPALKRFYRKSLQQESFTVLDIGANKGQSIDFFLSINPSCKIHAFEPNRKLFSFLKEKYNMQKDQVKIYNVGVSSSNGQFDFHENLLDETSTFEKVNMQSKYLEKKARILGVKKEELFIDSYKVQCIRLADFISEHRDEFFDVLKIDVEGHELSCLKGLFGEGNSQLPIRYIQLENHHDDMYQSKSDQSEIDTLLDKNGFEKAASIKHNFGDFSEEIYVNKYEA